MSNQNESSYARARRRVSRVDWRAPYLAALEANGGSFKRAAAAASVAYSTVWEHRNQDHEFARGEDLAVKRAQRVLESEAVRRAVEGTKVTRFQPKTGKPFYDLQYSDTLLLRLLEKNETGTWRQRLSVEADSPSKTFNTEVDRKKALAAARKELGLPETAELTPLNGGS